MHQPKSDSWFMAVPRSPWLFNHQIVHQFIINLLYINFLYVYNSSILNERNFNKMRREKRGFNSTAMPVFDINLTLTILLQTFKHVMISGILLSAAE